jgi:hypothetical protein
MAANGDLAAVRSLLSAGADPDAVDNSEVRGWTALMAAARAGSVDVVDALIKAHANIDSTNGYGATALDIAIATNGCESAVAKLIRASGGRGRKACSPAETAQSKAVPPLAVPPPALPSGTVAKFIPKNGVDPYGEVIVIAKRNYKGEVTTSNDFWWLFSEGLQGPTHLMRATVGNDRVVPATTTLNTIRERWKKAGVTLHLQLNGSYEHEYNNCAFSWRIPSGYNIAVPGSLPGSSKLVLEKAGEILMTQIETLEVAVVDEKGMSADLSPDLRRGLLVTITLRGGKKLPPDRPVVPRVGNISSGGSVALDPAIVCYAYIDEDPFFVQATTHLTSLVRASRVDTGQARDRGK